MTKAHAGRSSYLAATELQGVADPGAVAIAVAFEAAASIIGRAPHPER
jgi:dihydroxyacetone kinase